MGAVILKPASYPVWVRIIDPSCIKLGEKKKIGVITVFTAVFGFVKSALRVLGIKMSQGSYINNIRVIWMNNNGSDMMGDSSSPI